MTDKEAHYRIAHAYLAAVTAGDLPDAMLTSDMTGWTTTGGTIPKAAYQKMIRLLKAMCAAPLVFTVQALTADEDRVVIEATSQGPLVSGEIYNQTYVFILRTRGELIAAVAEHYNAEIVGEKLLPLMASALAKVGSDP